jgi:hypothetical protein
MGLKKIVTAGFDEAELPGVNLELSNFVSGIAGALLGLCSAEGVPCGVCLAVSDRPGV